MAGSAKHSVGKWSIFNIFARIQEFCEPDGTVASGASARHFAVFIPMTPGFRGTVKMALVAPVHTGHAHRTACDSSREVVPRRALNDGEVEPPDVAIALALHKPIPERSRHTEASFQNDVLITETAGQFVYVGVEPSLLDLFHVALYLQSATLGEQRDEKPGQLDEE